MTAHMEYKLIKLMVQDAIATISLNRPDKRNAMSDDMRTEFISALEHVNATKEIKALVITGEGKGFCAGGDVAGMQQRMSAPAGQVAFNGWHRQQRVQYAQTLLYTMPKPTIAAVNGPASGLGSDLAMACDFIVASESASFAWSYIKRGIIADGGGMYFLPRRIGLPKAKELIYTGRAVDATEALKLGIADRLSSPSQLVADAQAWASELSQHSSTALALGKTILNQSFELSAQQVFNLGSQAQGICYTSEEHRASVMAFLEKKPQS
jgi:enoyl-CoA hydratase/carnithine racemase